MSSYRGSNWNKERLAYWAKQAHISPVMKGGRLVYGKVARDCVRKAMMEHALTLYTAGTTIAQINEEEGYRYPNPTMIYQILDNAATQYKLPEIQTLLRQHHTRLESLYRAVEKQALEGDVKSAKTCVDILARMAKMLGVDAPDRVDVTSAGQPLKTIEINMENALPVKEGENDTNGQENANNAEINTEINAEITPSQTNPDPSI